MRNTRSAITLDLLLLSPASRVVAQNKPLAFEVATVKPYQPSPPSTLEFSGGTCRGTDKQHVAGGVLSPKPLIALSRMRHLAGAALQSREAMLRKNQPLMSGFEWIIILFVGVIPFARSGSRSRGAGLQPSGCAGLRDWGDGHLCPWYFAIRPIMLPD
jgi:hypothetical protein